MGCVHVGHQDAVSFGHAHIETFLFVIGSISCVKVDMFIVEVLTTAGKIKWRESLTTIWQFLDHFECRNDLVVKCADVSLKLQEMINIFCQFCLRLLADIYYVFLVHHVRLAGCVKLARLVALWWRR